MMIRAALGGTALMTMACAPIPPAEPVQEQEQLPVQGAGTCNAERAQGLVGRQGTGELGAEALRLTTARTLRWIPPGAMVTMDYREDRLNVELDGQNRVTRIRCG